MKQFTYLDDGLHRIFIDYMHKYYNDRLEFYGIQGTDSNRFSWSGNKKVLIYGIRIYLDVSGVKDPSNILIFATPSETQNKILFLDLAKETKTSSFIKQYDKMGKLNWLINNKLVSTDIVHNIIPGSLGYIYGDFKDIKIKYNDEPSFVSGYTERWTKEWIDAEYNATLEVESNPTPVNYFPNTFKRYFIDKYHFEDMLKEINNEQFTDEFNQCLFAYEHEKWFLCASGLGSCLEHLMYIILNNYAQKGYDILNRFPKDPTAKDYVNRFRRKPIGIDSRQARAINLFFMARNSVDHYNSGKTQRIFCDLLLDGISDVYNDYFGNSMNAPIKNE